MPSQRLLVMMGALVKTDPFKRRLRSPESYSRLVVDASALIIKHKRLALGLIAIVTVLAVGTALAFFMVRQFSADFIQSESDQHRRIKSYTTAIRSAAADQRDNLGRCPAAANQHRQDCLDAANESGRAAANAASLRYADSNPAHTSPPSPTPPQP